VKKLLLLCPAFGLVARWQEFLSTDDLHQWKTRGSHSYDGHQLHYEFYDDITKNHPEYPQILCPTSIVHGKLDCLVPIEASRTFIQKQIDQQSIDLTETDDDHYLQKSLPEILKVLSTFINKNLSEHLLHFAN